MNNLDFDEQIGSRFQGLRLNDNGEFVARIRDQSVEPMSVNVSSRSVDYLQSCIIDVGFLPNKSSTCFRDYGFANCKATDDELKLLSLYAQLIKEHGCNLTKLHEACESGKLQEFIQAEFAAKTNSETQGPYFAWFLQNVDIVNNKNTKHIVICPVCKVRCAQKCANCNLVSYCCRDHQVRHWRFHKSQCFPVKIMNEVVKNKSGRVLVATRPIKQGEIIIKEDPLVSGPYLQNEASPTNEFPVCLGCHNVMGCFSSYVCSKCEWPVCSERCELLPSHANFECKLFQASPCPPLDYARKNHYLSILFVRCMMLKESRPDIWEKLLALNAEGLNQFRSDYAIDLLKLSRDITADEEVELKKLVDIMDTNRKVTETYSGNNRRETHIYDLSSYTDHSCIPNSMWIIQKKDNKCFVRASVPIAEGEVITTSDTDLSRGIKERREFLKICNIDCKCKRCADPTECGTFMSAMKCTGCRRGYLLPKEPLKIPFTDWICNEAGCDEKVSDSSIEIRVQTLREKVNELIGAHATSPSTLKEMEKLIKTASREWVHPNHYLVVLLKRKYGYAVPLLAPYIENPLERSLFEEKMVAWTKECLTLVDIYWPGYSRFRGQTLYELQRGMFCLIFTEAEKIMQAGRGGRVVTSESKKEILKTAFKEVLALRKEVTTILSIEPAGGVEHNWANEVRIEGADFGIVRQVLQYQEAE